MYLISPKGTIIIGTLEDITGRCEIVIDSFTRDGGGIDWVDAGETEVFWDGQETRKHPKDGGPVFLDGDGDEFAGTDCKLVEALPDNDEEPESGKPSYDTLLTMLKDIKAHTDARAEGALTPEDIEADTKRMWAEMESLIERAEAANA